MRIEIGSWTLQKSKHFIETDSILPVSIIANRFNVDKVDDQIDPLAFTPDVIDFFLKEGIVDWQHESRTAPTTEQRAFAILGKPVDFEWYTENNQKLPKVYANLTKDHKIVKEAIMPHLKADQPVLGASVGGSILETIKTFNEILEKIVRKILKIKWDHIAIAGRPYVMSDGSAVTLAKSIIYQEKNQSVLEDIVSFNNLESFNNSSLLAKSLEAGQTPAIALAKQSLEKAMDIAIDYINGLQNGSIPVGKQALIDFYISKGLSKDIADKTYNFIKLIVGENL